VNPVNAQAFQDHLQHQFCVLFGSLARRKKFPQMRAVQFAAAENNEEICHSQAQRGRERAHNNWASHRSGIISAALEKKRIDGNHYAGHNAFF
jgi:hypothetical protein